MGNSMRPVIQVVRKKFRITAKWIIGCLYLLVGSPGYKSKIIAFVFHEVSDIPRAHARLTNTYSTKKNFLKQISLLSATFTLIDSQTDPLWTDKAGGLITFDDGYKGGLAAAKVLEVLGVASIHLVNLETIYGKINSSALLHFLSVDSAKETIWSDSRPKVMTKLLPELSKTRLDELSEFSGPYMNSKELQELDSLTHTVLGDHFLNHWHANSLTKSEIIENLSRDAQNFSESRKMKPYFAAPHGQLDIERMELISNQGYEVIFSGSSWLKLSNTSIVPRIDMNNSIRSKASLFGAIAILIIRSKRKPKN